MNQLILKPNIPTIKHTTRYKVKLHPLRPDNAPILVTITNLHATNTIIWLGPRFPN